MRPATSASLSPGLPRPNCPRNGHLKGRVCPGARWLVPIARTYTWRSPDVSRGDDKSLARKQTISHSTKNVGTENKTLVLVPLKVTSNGEPEAGNPGAKDGAVGHGGPQFAYTPIRSPVSTTKKPAVTWAAIHRRGCMRTGNYAGIFCRWFIVSFGVPFTSVFYVPNGPTTRRSTRSIDQTEPAASPPGLTRWSPW